MPCWTPRKARRLRQGRGYDVYHLRNSLFWGWFQTYREQLSSLSSWNSTWPNRNTSGPWVDLILKFNEECSSSWTCYDLQFSKQTQSPVVACAVLLPNLYSHAEWKRSRKMLHSKPILKNGSGKWDSQLFWPVQLWSLNNKCYPTRASSVGLPVTTTLGESVVFCLLILLKM